MAQRVAGLLVKLSADSAELKSDLRAIKSQLRGFGRSANREANRVKYAFNKIRRAAQVVASAFIFVAGIRQLGNLVSAMARAEDSVKLLEARFKQFARAPDAFTRIYDLSKELGVSLDETANGMTRLLVATKAMGTAQSVLEDIHKNIVILGRAGGTSTEEMKGAMRQLSQGLASGRLQGEELRSVLENLPLVAMEIADSMGIGIGQIRKAAAEGKITGQVVVDALAEIGIKMEDLPQTWAMQTENLRTEWSLFLADLSKSVDEAGLLEELTEAVKWVRLNLLGSFVGISTEDLKKQLAEAKKEIEFLENPIWPKSTTDKYPDQEFPDHDKGVDLTFHPLGGFGIAHNKALNEQLDIQRRITEELEKRDVLDKAAAKLAAVRNELVTGDDGARAAIDKLLRTYETAEEKVARLREELLPLREVDVERFNKIYKQLGETLNDGINEISIKGLPKLKRATKETTEEMSEYAKRAAQNMQDAFADFLFDPFDKGVKGMLEGFLTAIRRMIAEGAAAEFFGSVKGGGGGGLGSFLRAIIPGFATGGSFTVGGSGGRDSQFVPFMGTPGELVTVSPKGRGAGGVTVINNIDARGADEARIMRIMPGIMEATKSQTISEIIKMRNEGSM